MHCFLISHCLIQGKYNRAFQYSYRLISISVARFSRNDSVSGVPTLVISLRTHDLVSETDPFKWLCIA